MPDDFDDIRERLVAIADELGERGLALLRDAVEAGATKAPEAEKRIARARRSIDKAIHLLDG